MDHCTILIDPAGLDYFRLTVYGRTVDVSRAFEQLMSDRIAMFENRLVDWPISEVNYLEMNTDLRWWGWAKPEAPNSFYVLVKEDDAMLIKMKYNVG